MSLDSVINPNVSDCPFQNHRDVLVEGRYGTARNLRGLVLQLCEGKQNLFAVGIGGLDKRHLTILVEITWWLSVHGSNTRGLNEVIHIALEERRFADQQTCICGTSKHEYLREDRDK